MHYITQDKKKRIFSQKPKMRYAGDLLLINEANFSRLGNVPAKCVGLLMSAYSFTEISLIKEVVKHKLYQNYILMFQSDSIVEMV